MSASKNAEAMAQQGEFSSRVPPSEPLESGGHKPGVLASSTDRAPEFSAETHPAGTAPASSTHIPNPDLNNQKLYQSASSTLQGADSASVHTGLGHPGQGQTSHELHHDGRQANKKDRTGPMGLTSKMETSVNERDPAFASQRSLDTDVPAGERGNVGGVPAEARVPVGAEGVASEAPRK